MFAQQREMQWTLGVVQRERDELQEQVRQLTSNEQECLHEIQSLTRLVKELQQVIVAMERGPDSTRGQVETMSPPLTGAVGMKGRKQGDQEAAGPQRREVVGELHEDRLQEVVKELHQLRAASLEKDALIAEINEQLHYYTSREVHESERADYEP
jgi:uncharacterized coiled-coil DUF342 family protein